LEFHFPHTECPMEIGQRRVGSQRRWRKEEKSQVLGLRGTWGPGPDASAGSNPLEPELDCIRLRSEGCPKDKKRLPVRQVLKRTLH